MTQISVRARPCDSCPYRKDCPSGVWDAEEYAKLPNYDKETQDQPMSLFMCHQAARDKPINDLCAGWLHVHGDELIALRLGLMTGSVAPEVLDALDAGTDVPLFESGQAAADNGLAKIKCPDDEANVMIDKLSRIKGIQ